LEVVPFRQQLPPLFIQRRNLADTSLIPPPPRSQPLTNQIRIFTNQFNIEHNDQTPAIRETAPNASANFSGCFPPAMARSALPPPPPPQIFASSPTILPACLPALTKSGVT